EPIEKQKMRDAGVGPVHQPLVKEHLLDDVPNPLVPVAQAIFISPLSDEANQAVKIPRKPGNRSDDQKAEDKRFHVDLVPYRSIVQRPRDFGGSGEGRQDFSFCRGFSIGMTLQARRNRKGRGTPVSSCAMSAARSRPDSP